MATVRAGSGEPVLWIHGYTMDSGIWVDLWRQLPGWAHVGVDLPGHGASPALSRGTDIAAIGQEVAALAVDEGARHVVGISYGGAVALQVAIERPDAFSTLVLASAPFSEAPPDPHAQTRSRQLAALYRQRGPGPWMTELWMTAPPDIFTGAAARPELWHRLRAIVDRHRWDELADGLVQHLAVPTHPPSALARIQAATLVVVGEHDMPSVKRAGELLRRALPGSRRVYAPDAGHLCLLESPASAAIVGTHLSGGHEPPP